MPRLLIFLLALWPFPALSQSFPLLSTGRASCESLWVERNQILNVAGACFETALGQAVFDNGDCSPGPPALGESALNRIARLQQAEERLACQVNTSAGQVTVFGRYGPMRFGQGGLTLGRWPGALETLDVFPRDAGRVRSCIVSGLNADGDAFLALRSGPDVRYPQIGQLLEGERVISTSVCEGRWCFADSVQTGNRPDRRIGWFHVRWCRP